MVAIVRLALKRPYTFIVMAILIVLFGGLAAVRTFILIGHADAVASSQRLVQRHFRLLSFCRSSPAFTI